MNDYCAYYANCLSGGDTISADPGGGWIRDKIIWNFNGHKIILHQNKDIITKPIGELRNIWIASSKLIIKNIPLSKVKYAENISKDIGWLLSFAGYSRVCVYGNEYPSGSGSLKLFSTVGVSRYFRPTIDIRHGKKVKDFIEQCLPNYRKLKRKRKLPEIFDMLISSEASIPIELRLVSVFIALESLKDTFAKVNGIPYANGFFRILSTPPKANIGKEKIYSFEKLLSLMLKEYNIEKGLKRIITLRNDLIHSGISRRPYASKMKIFETCHDVIRLYLLKLLGYSGKYCCYSKPNTLLKT